MSTVESLVRRLSEVQDLLVALPDDAFAERDELLRLRDQLRAQAELHAAGADPERLTEELLAEIALLRRQLCDMIGEQERLRIEGRIERLERILDERQSDGTGHS
ncbi:MAG: hypothetical protein QNJ81_03880 [Acidimicrobiia bacterium]|nr:hypothetical protein [Acidimicrobiia bacterium]